MASEPITEFMGDYRWLSNFASVDVLYEGVVYESVEHAYQAAKSHDPNYRKRIAGCRTPGEAKKLGSSLGNGVRRDWRQVQIKIMRDLLVQKFNQEPYKTLLAETVGRKLVEGNWWGDEFWGVCKGVGENWLGRLIMEIRDGVPAEPQAQRQDSLF